MGRKPAGEHRVNILALKERLEDAGNSLSSASLALGKSRSAISRRAYSKQGKYMYCTRAELDGLARHAKCEAEDLLDDSAIAPPAEGEGTSQAAARGLTILDRAGMDQFYEKLGVGDFVWIFSTDGFIEAKAEAFCETVRLAVERGLEVWYLFPDSDLAQDSIVDYHALRKELDRDLSAIQMARVRGCFVDAANRYVLTRASRFVLRGRLADDGARQVTQVLLYFFSSQDYWIELNLTEHREFILQLERAIDPVPVPVPSLQMQWKLSDHVKEPYQVAFSDTSDVYKQLRESLGTRESAERIAIRAYRHFFDLDLPGNSSIVQWLDIGCENGENTGVMQEYLRSHSIVTALTAIDSSKQYEPHPAVKHSAFLNGRDCTFERLAETLPRSKKFDLITCLHSWYTIDPYFLFEAYRRLTPNGILLISLGPYGQVPELGANFINSMCGVIDRHTAKHSRRNTDDDLYLGKVARNDPYRNFAEDLVAACEKFFGKRDMAFEVDINKRLAPADKWFQKGKLTEAGKVLVRFFAHGSPIRGFEAELFEDVERTLQQLLTDEKLPADEVDITINRADLMRWLRSMPPIKPRAQSDADASGYPG